MSGKRKPKTVEGLNKDQVTSLEKELLATVVTDINAFIALETEKLGCDKDKVQELIKKIITQFY